MDIRPTDLPITQAREVDVVRRVDAASDRQGKREQAGRDANEDEAGGEGLHDTVDVSSEYQPALVEPPSPAAPLQEASATDDGMRHLDIEV